jgi:hypothetical protein
MRKRARRAVAVGFKLDDGDKSIRITEYLVTFERFPCILKTDVNAVFLLGGFIRRTSSMNVDRKKVRAFIGFAFLVLLAGSLWTVAAGTLRTEHDFAVELHWEGPADLDLIVAAPDGQRITYASPRVGGGALVLDANGFCHRSGGSPVEQVVFPAWASQSGMYYVIISYALVCENNPAPVEWQVTVRNGDTTSAYIGQIAPGEVAPVGRFMIQ